MRTRSSTDRHDEAKSRFLQLWCVSTEILFVSDCGIAMFMEIRAQLEYFVVPHTIRFILHTVMHAEPLCSHNGNTKTHWKVRKTLGLICKQLKNVKLTLFCGLG
jgi:hypothetical protein